MKQNDQQQKQYRQTKYVPNVKLTLCKAKTLNGKRCKNQSAISVYCEQHWNQIKNKK